MISSNKWTIEFCGVSLVKKNGPYHAPRATPSNLRASSQVLYIHLDSHSCAWGGRSRGSCISIQTYTGKDTMKGRIRIVECLFFYYNSHRSLFLSDFLVVSCICYIRRTTCSECCVSVCIVCS